MASRLTTRISYEWTLEHKDEHDDIVDVEFFDEKDCPSLPTEDNIDLGLIRRAATGYPDDEYSYDEDYREYLYPVNGTLPDEFEDGYSVPKRLRKVFTEAQS